MTEVAWGTPMEAAEGELLGGTYTQQLATACAEHPDFTIVGWRRLQLAGETFSDYLIVDAHTGAPGRNEVGIRTVERLALGEQPSWLMPLDVRALRAEFPDVLHLNGVGPAEPKSLCLYEEVWPALSRSWTAARHLARIQWWLKQTALGALHAPDQPLEPVFYASPVRIILPRAVKDVAPTERIQLQLTERLISRRFHIWRGSIEAAASAVVKGTSADAIVVSLPPVDSRFIRKFPSTLGALHQVFVEMGSNLLAPLREAIQQMAGEQGINMTPSQEGKHVLVLLRIPRSSDDQESETQILAFQIRSDLNTLAQACGALRNGGDGRLYPFTIVTAQGNAEWSDEVWRACCDIAVEAAVVLFEINDHDARLFSGVDDNTASFRGMLVGVGSLGGLLAEIWAREGWGRWDLVDDDVLLPHNVVRHIGKNSFVGSYKAHIVRAMSGFELDDDTAPGAALTVPFVRPFGAALARHVADADLIVDASTTLYVGRDALDDQTRARMVSVFLTPSGHSSVLLMDSADRSVRVGHLEAQYYRAILNSDWGQDHLRTEGGRLDVGSGCRDASVVMSNEVIHLHAGLLSRQLRLSRLTAAARMCVWTMNDTTGGLAADELQVSNALEEVQGDWRVIWDEGLKTSLFERREAHLPNETGGILLGYTDQQLKIVFVVDGLGAPPDSQSSPERFIRGKEGVAEAIKNAEDRTAGIVSYIGEWHSHPTGHPPTPSKWDDLLLDHFFKLRVQESLPTVMIIVGHNNETNVSLASPPEIRA